MPEGPADPVCLSGRSRAVRRIGPPWTHVIASPPAGHGLEAASPLRAVLRLGGPGPHGLTPTWPCLLKANPLAPDSHLVALPTLMRKPGHATEPAFSSEGAIGADEGGVLMTIP